MKAGVCRLTGQHGIFLKSHIIPAALTRREKGEAFIEAGLGREPKRAWNSWFDAELVNQDGEKILTAHDTWAINFLRKHRMIWSGWGAEDELEPSSDPNTTFAVVDRERGLGIRSISDVDARPLRLFYLSLLWRAAATRRSEFAEVCLTSTELETLRQIVTGECADRFDLFPIALTQLSTRGPLHNLTPIRSTQDFVWQRSSQ
ncbi:hypothetical protein [Cupriavidus consociatus]|uniref:hypothetical protein n=1 Tax=Cupriavidus consociatus TaxID=2821357 RepID=UPI001AEB618A|nr:MULTISPECIES: hypothetical protein [unclassified Cupriavidus]MBP0622875.1 hypothetical protein [Cupriavidus sp. LEh25]MDK2659562.1 hypothetical protein [Cupriavidus sp. LEh21]